MPAPVRQVDIARVLQQVANEANQFYRGGKVLADKLVQTDELDCVNLSEVDAIAGEIRADVEITHRMLQVNSNQKFRDIQGILHSVIMERLMFIQTQFRNRLQEVRHMYSMKLRHSLDRLQAEEDTKKEQILSQVIAAKETKLNDKLDQLSKAKKLFRGRDDEYQQLRFMAARYFMLLRKHNIADVEIVEDEDRVQIAGLMEKYHDSIAQCDETIRGLRVQIFQLEELIERSHPQRFGSREGGGGAPPSGKGAVEKHMTPGSRISSAAPRPITSRAAKNTGGDRTQTPLQKQALRQREDSDVKNSPYHRTSVVGINEMDVTSHQSLASSRDNHSQPVGKSRRISTGNRNAWDAGSKFHIPSGHSDDKANFFSNMGGINEFTDNEAALEHAKESAMKKAREALLAKLEEECEMRLQEAIVDPEAELDELRSARARITREWEARFRSAEGMYSNSHLDRILRRQARILKLAGCLVKQNESKIPKADKQIDGYITGLPLFEATRLENLRKEAIAAEERERELQERVALEAERHSSSDVDMESNYDNQSHSSVNHDDAESAGLALSGSILGHNPTTAENLSPISESHEAAKLRAKSMITPTKSTVGSVVEASRARSMFSPSRPETSTNSAFDPLDAEIVRASPQMENLWAQDFSMLGVEGTAAPLLEVVPTVNVTLTPRNYKSPIDRSMQYSQSAPYDTMSMSSHQSKLPSLDRFNIRPWSANSSVKTEHNHDTQSKADLMSTLKICSLQGSPEKIKTPGFGSPKTRARSHTAQSEPETIERKEGSLKIHGIHIN
ncbi:hypothetical protein HDU97_000766 [Phlyctochytrium planicorne]|nr:hypothetical protein HDU97_000766 [Phlyctochytrium planicorne]